MTNLFYKLFGNCVLVKGANRSTVCDLQRNKYHLIPNSLHDIFIDGTIDVAKVISQIDDEGHVVLSEYLDFLKDNEFIFECEQELLDNFPPLSLSWEYPSHITNAVFDAVNKFTWFTEDTLTQLEELCCNYIELRSFEIWERTDFERIINLIIKSSIKSIDIITKWDSQDGFIKWLSSFVMNHKKIRCITVHSSPTNEIHSTNGNTHGNILLIKEIISSEKNCGSTSSIFFCSNVKMFTESQNFNTCLNRKIAIDAAGDIKNCPSTSKNYGNIRDTKLMDVVGNSEFRKLWYIHKDQIDVCKDCEFRHICTDCRAYLENPDDIYSKPLKCGYNPYTCEWEKWSDNPIKQNAIDHYEMREIIKN